MKRTTAIAAGLMECALFALGAGQASAASGDKDALPSCPDGYVLVRVNGE